MADMNQAERFTVLDSEGVRGTIAARALQQPDAQILIVFDQGRKVEVSRDMLRETGDGNYILPISLRALADKSPASQPGGKNNDSERSEKRCCCRPGDCRRGARFQAPS